MTYTLHLGDCIDVMRAMPDNSVDSIVTDPPYHLTTGKKGGTGEASLHDDPASPFARASKMNLGGERGFMGMTWDGGNIAFTVELWREALRVLKPGGHLLAFSGSRTYHRMACAIEDAGFEVRDRMLNLCGPETKYGALWDSLNDEQRGALAELLNDQLGLGSEAAWTYGSGFPKSMNVSKAIDKAAGAERKVIGVSATKSGIADGNGGPQSRDTDHAWTAGKSVAAHYPITESATDAARQWDGWGTALKPAHEPICVARKPLAKGCTVAANVLAHGTGAINIDGCRVSTAESQSRPRGSFPHSDDAWGNGRPNEVSQSHESGRWPANLIHDGSAEVVALFPESTSGAMKAGTLRAAQDGPGSVCYGTYGGNATSTDIAGSTGSAARFFYCAKTSKADRNEGCENIPAVGVSQQYGLKTSVDGREGRTEGERTNTERANIHPTVKPTDLMAYLVRLVTPPGGVVLDPFMGSGSTGKAAMREGFRFIGAELSPDYLAIAEARIASEQAKATARTAAAKVAAPQRDLFAAAQVNEAS